MIGYLQIPTTDDFNLNDETELRLIYQYIGGNAGNLLFLNAPLSFLHPKCRVENVDPRSHPDTYDNIILPCANHIGKHVSNSYILYLQNILDKFNANFFAIGLGAQNTYDEYLCDETILSPALKYFLQSLSSKCHTIFLRDNNTKEILNHLGIMNVSVAGCPSILLNSSSKLGDKIDENLRYLRANPCHIKGTITYQTLSPDSKFTRKLFRLSKRYNDPLIVQDNFNFLKSMFVHNKVSTLILKKIFKDYDGFRFFYKLQDWLNFLDGFNMSYGARIHGTIANIIKGNVGVNICHDVRTRGLCETLNIPHLYVNDFLALDDNNIRQNILQHIEFDKEAFNSDRVNFAKMYLDEFEHLRVPLSPHLYDIIEQRPGRILIPPFSHRVNRTLPDGFDVSTYTQLNPDLRKLTRVEAKVHYLINGCREQRRFRL